MNKIRSVNLEEVKSTRERSRDTNGRLTTALAGGIAGPTRNTITMMKSGSDRSGTLIPKKKVDDDADEEDPYTKLIEKCMHSKPNSMSLEQIKKLQAFVWAFGSNEMAELGVGHYNEATMPERARGLPKVKIASISSGGKHTGIVTVDGKLWMCGSRKFEQLGIEKLMTSSIKSFKPVELMNDYKVA